jgi:hypothetical protein
MDQFALPKVNGRVAQCDGKVSFRIQKHAKEAANRRKNRVVYRCQHCFQWHVGTPPPKAKKFSKRQKLVRLFLQPEWSTNE